MLRQWAIPLSWGGVDACKTSVAAHVSVASDDTAEDDDTERTISNLTAAEFHAGDYNILNLSSPYCGIIVSRLSSCRIPCRGGTHFSS